MRNIILLVLLFTAISCSKFVEIDPPATQLSGSEVFRSDATAEAVISKLYANCILIGYASGGNQSITVLAALAADELDYYASTDEVNQFYKNTMLPKNALSGLLWDGAYQTVYQSNLILEGLSAGSNVSAAVKDRLRGEALFMRAFAHFYIANLFGNVPYVTSTDYEVNATIAQTDYKSVLGLIIKDLQQAKELLPEDYAFAGNERIRPNKWAATALLARTYLYNEDWTHAEQEASLVISQNSLYGLPALNEVFLKNSKEAIWQLKPVSTTLNTTEGALFVKIAKPTNYALKPDAKSMFEPNDLRAQSWVGTFSNASGTWYFPHKYKIRSGATPLNEYSMVLRLAEQYLIRAEARAKLGNLAGAINDIDAVRSRAGIPKLSVINPGIGKEALLLAIAQERRVELFTEWGHRWFDLKRTKRIDEVLASKPGWSPDWALLPIPANDIAKNRSLIQNKGYQ